MRRVAILIIVLAALFCCFPIFRIEAAAVAASVYTTLATANIFLRFGIAFSGLVLFGSFVTFLPGRTR